MGNMALYWLYADKRRAAQTAPAPPREERLSDPAPGEIAVTWRGAAAFGALTLGGGALYAYLARRR
jgi:hypothetical protein